jgi:hypothetical protein
MNAKSKVACEFLKAIGCTEVKAEEADRPFVGVVKAVFKGKPLVVSLQVRPEWGMDLPTPTGRSWNDSRYPFNSVQFLLPAGADKSTHYISMGGDGRRLVLTPRSNIDDAVKAWTQIGKGEDVRMIRSAAVANWTPRLVFFILGDGGWEKDTGNIWQEPTPMSMDPDQFLQSLG